MRVRILIGAEAAYAFIQTLHASMNVLLATGRPAPQSLRETAAEWRERAARLQQQAMYMEEAAALLEEDERSGRRYASR